MSQGRTFPTVGELERQLSQGIQSFYRKHFNHRPSRVVCQLFDSTLAIVMEDSITKPEQLLDANGQSDLAETIHDQMHSIVRPKLIQLIENTLGVNVADLLTDATLETGRAGIIAILQQSPSVRNPEVLPKYKSAESNADSNDEGGN